MVSLIALFSFLAQVSAPALPPLESFPPAARQLIEPAHKHALAQPTDASAVAALGRALHAWEQWSLAHEAYARAQQLDRGSFEWHYLDAIVLRRLARHAEAAGRLGEALAIAPEYLPARVMLAEEMFEAGRFDESRTLFTELAREPAAEPSAEAGLGRLDAREGRHGQAIAHFERAVTLFPELGAAYYGLALSYRALGRSDEARRALTRHQQYGPRWPAIDDPILARVTMLRDDARTLVKRGVRLGEEGDLDGAIAAHEAALARDPGLTQAHANLIALYGRTRNWSKAEEHYRAAVKAGAGLADVHYDYAVLLGLQEKWDLAENAYRQALAVNPLHPQAWNNLGQTLERQRRLADAADCYRRAVESQPGFRLARFNHARMLITLTRPGEAIAELEKIVEPRDAEAPRYLFALGVAHVHAGRRAEGVKWSMQAKALALQFGQTELAASIDRELAALK